ncbi:Flp pilus assembly protein CpaB [Halomonas getboli]|uniref:Flp pilus assembly protein CpaB n=1 Tax=Halomonas getboli TaxID=2935862 RepID=UPI001FFFE352|nr:Flp pilus assembly protein CpaB [Halomonas getboli]MCK2183438.1 Flp pilus assembly protein CpaB [Halomonas getboli]
MSPNLLKGIAALLVAVAIGLAFVGWRMANEVPETVATAPAVEAVAPRAAGHAVLTAARPLAVGTRLEAPGEGQAPLVQAVDYPEPLDDSFSDLAEVEGRVLTRPLAVGDVLRPSDFAAGGLLAEAVPAGMRGIAVSVDEVIGGGGFVAPGDRVDVFFYAQDSDGERTRLARRVLRNVEVLSYGSALSGQPPAEDDEGGAKRSGRTAVLALDERQAPRLLLAEQTGRLRLAVIGAEERRAALEPTLPEAGDDWLMPASLETGRDVHDETADAEPDDLGEPVDFDALMGREGKAAPARQPTPRSGGRQVVQQVGGQVRTVSVGG